GGTRTSPAQWFTAYSALSPVIGLVCHRRSADCATPLDASVGRQDHTALPSAPVPFVFDTACVHRIPRQRFVTTMIRPSERARDGEAYRGVSGQTRSDIFLQPGLDVILLICSSGKNHHTPSFRGAKPSGASPESMEPQGSRW